MTTDYDRICTDVLVLGSGVAGAWAALAASDAGFQVTLVTKGVFTRSGTTPIAGYACNAVFRDIVPEDSFESHFKDTIAGGAYLSNQRLVEVYTEEACDRVKEVDQ